VNGVTHCICHECIKKFIKEASVSPKERFPMWFLISLALIYANLFARLIGFILNGRIVPVWIDGVLVVTLFYLVLDLHYVRRERILTK
jgi:hypothetical protein